MPVTDAVRMDNFFPETSYLRLRRGSQTFCTISTTQPVQSLMTYSNASGQKLIAATNGNLYDVTTGTPASILSGVTSNLWEYTNFATPGGQFWVGVNGDAHQWTWNGTGSATAATNTSDTTSNLSDTYSMICAFQSRLFFCGPDNLVLNYLPVGVFQGEMHGIDLGSYFVRGGQIAFLGTWTRDDSTLGMNDLLVIGTTLGELLVYRGVDPDDPSNWFMVGRFEVGLPVAGHRQLCRLGPDMMLICQDGFQSIANYLAMGQSKALSAAISQKIGNVVSQAVKSNIGLSGWCAMLYSENNALIVNVPMTSGGAQQYVVNTITGAWCRFIGLNATCWVQFAGGLYFGAANGAVIQGDIGGTDNGVPIAFDLITAFQVFGNDMHQKRVTMARPYLIIAGQWNPVMDVQVDYTLSGVTSPLMPSGGGTFWDQFNWDQANWGSTGAPQHLWYSVQGIGNSFALRLSGTAVSASLQLLAFDVAYEAGMGFV